MHCRICDKEFDGLVDDKDGKVRHCAECETVVQELLDDYEKKDRKNKVGELEHMLEDEEVEEYFKYRYDVEEEENYS